MKENPNETRRGFHEFTTQMYCAGPEAVNLR